MNKTYNLLPFLLAVLCSCNNQPKQASSNGNPYKDLLIYKETVDENEHYIIEKQFDFDDIRYIKGFYCSDSSITYRYSAKFRVTPDTLFKCKSKEDDKGEPYLILNDNEYHVKDAFYEQLTTQHQGSIIVNGTKLFKFHVYDNAIDGKNELLYCDSKFQTYMIESAEQTSYEKHRIKIDTIPQSLVGIADSIQKLQFSFK